MYTFSFIKFRESRYFKGLAMYMAFQMLANIFMPTATWALTSGPSQQEFASFESASTSDMVDLYSGDFTYNIPVLSVPGPNGGYPINLAYHGGIGMEQEASWVGLGWNINVGAINRQMQGIPDDFNGEKVKYKMHTKPSTTVGINLDGFKSKKGEKKELFGFPPPGPGQLNTKVNFSKEIYYNNYRGLGYRLNFSKQARIANSSWLEGSLGLSFDSQNGIGVSASTTVNAFYTSNSFKGSYNSRSGLNSISLSSGFHFNANTVGNRNNMEKISFKSSSSLGFSKLASLPSVNMEMKNTSIPFSLILGQNMGTGSWQNKAKGIWSGYYSNSKVANNGNREEAAYGYLNERGKEGLKDLSRENILQTKKAPFLAPSKNSYDLFLQSGQGTGGSFRPTKNYIEVLSSEKTISKSKRHDIGLEFATPIPTIHIGIDYGKEKGEMTSGDWTVNTSDFDSDFDLSTSQPYFKTYGEHSGMLVGESNLSTWEDDEAMLAQIVKDDQGWLKKDYKLNNYFSKSFSQGTSNAPTSNQLKDIKTTTRRGKIIDYLTVSDAQEYGMFRYADFTKPSNLISEIQVTQQDGMRYIYGQPLYNTKQESVTQSFNESGNKNTNKVDVHATSYLDNTNLHSKEYYNESSLPQYAHSWLMTSVLSSDYIDSDGITGPSEGDYGYWTKFNYTSKMDYKWRTPYDGATFIDGSEGNPDDNMASFTYGEKEVRYIQSIETKTHIAVFELSDRKDGTEAEGKWAAQGQKGAKHLKKLDKIKLYTQAEYKNNPTSPVPLQTVHFNYNYDLCKGILNNSHSTSSSPLGKLTLNRVHFTYENSSRGLSPYVFNYGDVNNIEDNPNYDERFIDRWGNYKKNETYDSQANDYPYVDFPYTEQGTECNTFTASASYQEPPKAGAWCLKKVNLPTGGEFNINYELDDYAYVEDKKATRMFDILSVGNTNTFDPDTEYLETDVIYKSQGSISSLDDIGRKTMVNSGLPLMGNLENNFKEGNDKVYRIYFKLEKNIPSGTSAEERNDIIQREYVGSLTHLYFKNEMHLRTKQESNRYKDYVSGYAELSPNKGLPLYYGALKRNNNSSDYSIGYVSVKPVSIGKTGVTKVHPFRKAAIEHIRINRPEIAFGMNPPSGSNSPLNQISNVVSSTFSVIGDVMQMALGYNRWAKLKNWGKHINLSGHSIIKLEDPYGNKKGGGDRVKSFVLSDNWVESNSNYGQEYDYTTQRNGKIISSGVAYEPNLGKEESALTEYLSYSESTPLSTPYSLMVEKPLLSSFYPGASVGYSKVTVRSIAPSEADKSTDGVVQNGEDEIELANSSAPVTVYAFYTGKDFPVYHDITDLDPSPNIFRFVPIPGFASDLRVKKAKSQGFSIVLNDMAGKMKSVASYVRKYALNGNQRLDELGELISKTEYTYHTKTNESNKLNNTVKVLTDDLAYATGVLGETIDIHIDRNENKELSKTRGVNLNLEFGVLPLPFIPIPIPIPQSHKTEYSHKTITTNKVIHRSGILKSVKITTDASAITTENVAFDLHTGEALLTKVYNEYEDPLYNYSIPAHYKYPNTGPMFGREAIFSLGSFSVSGGVINTSGSNYHTGDEVALKYIGGNSFRATVIGGSSTSLKCIDFSGFPIHNGTITSIKMVRPIERNLLTSKVGSVAFQGLQNLNSSSGTFTYDKVLNASAIELSDEWQTICADCNKEDGSGNIKNVGNVNNPYFNGVKGNWRAKSTYAYNGKRNNQVTGTNNSQTDGIFESFVAFIWGNNNPNSDWIKATEVTKYSPFGFELEERNAVGNYSAAVYGYNNSILKALGQNLRYNELAFDGFEDYPMACGGEHFNVDFLANTNSSLNLKEAHTGKASLEVNSNSTVTSDYVPFYIDSCEDYAPNLNSDAPNYHTVDKCDCIGQFAPSISNSGEVGKYVISGWVKEEELVSDYTKTAILVEFLTSSGSSSVSFTPSGNIIEGWQRIYGEFNIPDNLISMSLKYINSGGNSAYFDDIRVHEYDGNMVSYVYNPINFRKEAELDANNYATFYIYDEEGNLNKVKKETSKGIQTLQEGRKFSITNP